MKQVVHGVWGILGIFGVALLTVSASAQPVAMEGGSTVGNGGAGLLCQSGNLGWVEMLDTYEARVLRGITFDLGPQSDAFTQVKYVLDRYSKTDAVRAARNLKRAMEFMADAAMIPDAELVKIPDTGALFIPKNCEMVQVAIQRPKQFPDDKKFVISGHLWYLMGESERAVLMLHEILYEELIENGAKDAVGARYFNAYLSGDKFRGVSDREYRDYLARFKLGLPAMYGPYELDADRIGYYSSGALKSGYGPHHPIDATTVAGARIRLFPHYLGGNDSRSTWFESGVPAELHTPDPVALPRHPEIKVFRTLKFVDGSGELIGGVMAGDFRFVHHQPQGGPSYELRTARGGWIEFFQSGSLRTISLGTGVSTNITPPSLYQGEHELKFGYWYGSPEEWDKPIVEFWENGRIRSGLFEGELPIQHGKASFVYYDTMQNQRKLEFHANCAIASGYVKNKTIFWTVKEGAAVAVMVEPWTWVELDDQGYLIK